MKIGDVVEDSEQNLFTVLLIEASPRGYLLRLRSVVSKEVFERVPSKLVVVVPDVKERE